MNFLFGLAVQAEVESSASETSAVDEYQALVDMKSRVQQYLKVLEEVEQNYQRRLKEHLGTPGNERTHSMLHNRGKTKEGCVQSRKVSDPRTNIATDSQVEPLRTQLTDARLELREAERQLHELERDIKKAEAEKRELRRENESLSADREEARRTRRKSDAMVNEMEEKMRTSEGEMDELRKSEKERKRKYEEQENEMDRLFSGAIHSFFEVLRTWKGKRGFIRWLRGSEENTKEIRRRCDERKMDE